MRKILISILSLGLLFSLGSCNHENDNKPTPDNNNNSNVNTVTAAFDIAGFTKEQARGKLDSKANQDRFVSWFNKNAQMNILASVSGNAAVEDKTCSDDKGNDISYYCVGSKNASSYIDENDNIIYPGAGEVTFNFSTPLTKLGFDILPYYNYSPDWSTGVNIPKWTNAKNVVVHTKVDDAKKDFTIPTLNNGMPEICHIDLEFSKPSVSFTLSSDPGLEENDVFIGRNFLIRGVSLEYEK